MVGSGSGTGLKTMARCDQESRDAKL
jgi:hypothetical protein